MLTVIIKFPNINQVIEIGSVGKSFDQGVRKLFAHTTGVRYLLLFNVCNTFLQTIFPLKSLIIHILSQLIMS